MTECWNDGMLKWRNVKRSEWGKGRNVERVGMSIGSKETSKRVTRWIRRKQLVFRSPLKQLNPRNRTSGDMFLNGGRLWLQLRLSREKKEISLLFREFFFKFLRNICWLRCQWHWRVVSTFLHMQMMQGCKYLSVVKALCINTSAYDKGPSWVSILKIKGSKISWHCSLKYRGIGHFELAFYLDARFLDLF